jgi:hypothetical protein
MTGGRTLCPTCVLAISEYTVNVALTKVIDGRLAQTFRTSAMIPSPSVCCPRIREIKPAPKSKDPIFTLVE